jgi:hypothetical protein
MNLLRSITSRPSANERGNAVAGRNGQNDSGQGASRADVIPPLPEDENRVAGASRTDLERLCVAKHSRRRRLDERHHATLGSRVTVAHRDKKMPGAKTGVDRTVISKMHHSHRLAGKLVEVNPSRARLEIAGAQGIRDLGQGHDPLLGSDR